MSHPALGMCRVRSSPDPDRTERQRSPKQPGPQGNARTSRVIARPRFAVSVQASLGRR